MVRLPTLLSLLPLNEPSCSPLCSRFPEADWRRSTKSQPNDQEEQNRPSGDEGKDDELSVLRNDKLSHLYGISIQPVPKFIRLRQAQHAGKAMKSFIAHAFINIIAGD